MRLQRIWVNLSKISQQTILITMTSNTIKSLCLKELFQWAVKKNRVAKEIIRKNVMTERKDRLKIWLLKFLKAHKLYSLKDFLKDRTEQLTEPLKTRAVHLHSPPILKTPAKGTVKATNQITTTSVSSKIWKKMNSSIPLLRKSLTRSKNMKKRRRQMYKKSTLIRRCKPCLTFELVIWQCHHMRTSKTSLLTFLSRIILWRQRL